MKGHHTIDPEVKLKEKLRYSGVVTMTSVTPKGFFIMFCFYENVPDNFILTVELEEKTLFHEMNIPKSTAEVLIDEFQIDFPKRYWATYEQLCLGHPDLSFLGQIN